MGKKKEVESVSRPKKVTSTHRIGDYKLMQYKGVQMSRKMWKLWNLEKIASK